MSESPSLLLAGVFLAGGFLAGSVPFALLLGLLRGVDIRTVGSGNPGATNLGRALGFPWFAACFLLDAAKGLGPTIGYGFAAGVLGRAAVDLPPAHAFAWLGVMAAPIAGHMFSPWIGFRGGKGVATGLGALLGVWPVLTIPGAGAFVVFVAVFGVSRIVSLASVVAAGSLPVWTYYFFAFVATTIFREEFTRGEKPEPIPTTGWPFVLVTAVIAAVVILKHRANLARLASGTEPKVGDTRPGSRADTPAPTRNNEPPV